MFLISCYYFLVSHLIWNLFAYKSSDSFHNLHGCLINFNISIRIHINIFLIYQNFTFINSSFTGFFPPRAHLNLFLGFHMFFDLSFSIPAPVVIIFIIIKMFGGYNFLFEFNKHNLNFILINGPAKTFSCFHVVGSGYVSNVLMIADCNRMCDTWSSVTSCWSNVGLLVLMSVMGNQISIT